MRRTIGQIRAALDGSDAPPEQQPGLLRKRVRAVVYLVRVVARIFEQWARDRCPQQAAALAFQTTLSLVPVMAVGFALLRATGFLAVESRLLEFFATQLLPDLSDAAHQLEGFSQKVSIGAVGTGGLLFTLTTCYSLYSSVEKIYNDIWRVGVRRKRLGKVVTFAALITLLPFLAGAYLYWSGRLAGSGAAERFVGPLAIQFAAILLTNKLLPNTRVTWRAAVAGTVASGLLLEGGRALFVGFAKRTLLASYSGVYGPLALVPMLLIWIYVAWLLILLGAEVARAVAKMSATSADSLMSADGYPLVGR